MDGLIIGSRVEIQPWRHRAVYGYGCGIGSRHANRTGSRVASTYYRPICRGMFKKTRSALRKLLPNGRGRHRQPPATVVRVDLDRLLGTWFEVARLPNLEADGLGQRSVNVTATYAKRPDGRITVQTVSYNANAGMRRTEVNGTVEPGDPSGSKLILRFFKLIRGDLWVIGLDPNYRWALMGTPSRRRLWLIARDRCIDPADYAQAMDIAAARGFDAARVKPTEHHEPNHAPSQPTPDP